ncbi:small glutamine-rich tetratricopeptide repeat-containing protein alpha isoform X1 [Fukomys damarensis]|uniref:small glutamine-rich tetratricopeptide repeat-containing protein alpha isoform X1 n=1 Tax=Fukomys damarensis TaxID=885580 RepID=UPI0014555C05|nr:small glutamine-rich tetratricopeptide repeat-containing protein alpha isoform X1 [Fukomys damarensis]
MLHRASCHLPSGVLCGPGTRPPWVQREPGVCFVDWRRDGTQPNIVRRSSRPRPGGSWCLSAMWAPFSRCGPCTRTGSKIGTQAGAVLAPCPGVARCILVTQGGVAVPADGGWLSRDCTSSRGPELCVSCSWLCPKAPHTAGSWPGAQAPPRSCLCRAAAYSKLGDYAGAVRDCERAICLDPAYSKAYGRMGLALSSLNKHAEAVAYYKKALELDPDNETYKSNLKIAELKLRETPSPTSSVSGIDIAGLLNNPSFINMASSLMNSPQLQQLMSGMISGSHNPLGTPGTSPSQNDLSGLIQAGQQFAQHMQMQNPEFIEQLRSQMRSRTPSASNEEPQE